MKQEILCKSCAKNQKERVTHEPDDCYNEKCIEKWGEALHNYYCDLCGNIIKKGEACLARSLIGIGQTYFPWEEEFINKFKIGGKNE